MRPPTVKMAEMAAKDAGVIGMQSIGALSAVDEPNDSSFPTAEMDFFWQVMTSCGAFSSAWGRI